MIDFVRAWIVGIVMEAIEAVLSKRDEEHRRIREEEHRKFMEETQALVNAKAAEHSLPVGPKAFPLDWDAMQRENLNKEFGDN